jgi:chemotaxis family two-component system response regulator PixG
MPKVLIVEDDKIVRSGLKVLMMNEGFETYFTDDGAEAIRLAQQHRPDVVLCDIAMPVMDGYEVLRTLRGKPETAKIPVMFLTAKITKEEEQKGLAMGADAYLKKPMWPEEIVEAVKQQLSKSGR